MIMIYYISGIWKIKIIYNIVTYGIENDSMEKAQDINYLESSSII